MSQHRNPIPYGAKLDYSPVTQEFYISRFEGHIGRKYSSIRQLGNLLESKQDIKLTERADVACFNLLFKDYQIKKSKTRAAMTSQKP